MLYLDTHIVLWLYKKELEHFSSDFIELLEEQALYVSPMVKLEIDYLHEIGRIKSGGEKMLNYLHERIGVELDGISFVPVAERAAAYKWTHDPFDRIITAQADCRGADLLTKDRMILDHYRRAVAP